MHALTLKEVLCSFVAVEEYRLHFVVFERTCYSICSDGNPTAISITVDMEHDVEGSLKAVMTEN